MRQPPFPPQGNLANCQMAYKDRGSFLGLKNYGFPQPGRCVHLKKNFGAEHGMTVDFPPWRPLGRPLLGGMVSAGPGQGMVMEPWTVGPGTQPTVFVGFVAISRRLVTVLCRTFKCFLPLVFFSFFMFLWSYGPEINKNINNIDSYNPGPFYDHRTIWPLFGLFGLEGSAEPSPRNAKK